MEVQRSRWWRWALWTSALLAGVVLYIMSYGPYLYFFNRAQGSIPLLKSAKIVYRPLAWGFRLKGERDTGNAAIEWYNDYLYRCIRSGLKDSRNP